MNDYLFFLNEFQTNFAISETKKKESRIVKEVII
jgi:hypothetical protein